MQLTSDIYYVIMVKIFKSHKFNGVYKSDLELEVIKIFQYLINNEVLSYCYCCICICCKY